MKHWADPCFFYLERQIQEAHLLTILILKPNTGIQ
ncbi:hypothetical protein J3R74_002664 [Puniceicoccus vermicola]